MVRSLVASLVDVGRGKGNAAALLERLEHYFSTYKLVPGEPSKIVVVGRYGYEDAARVITAAIEDYREMIGPMSAEKSGSGSR